MEALNQRRARQTDKMKAERKRVHDNLVRIVIVGCPLGGGFAAQGSVPAGVFFFVAALVGGYYYKTKNDARINAGRSRELSSLHRAHEELWEKIERNRAVVDG